MAYTVDFNAHAYNGTLTVGDITVTGGDGKADNFADIANWLNLSSSEKVVIGNVDYSGYGGGAVTANVIDVSGYGGAAEVIGSDQKDMIYDNKGINAMTGGDGADTFVINAANSGKTATTVDQILDFNDADGDKIDLGVVINEFNYSEGTHADFDTFLAAANAADKAAYSGLEAGDVWAAVDNSGDLAVNYVIQLVGVNSLGDIDIASFDPIAG
jgi:Ca2+-binding RTX toxin-like protein